MSKLVSSETCLENPRAESTEILSAYDAPLVILDARAVASRLSKHADPAVAAEGQVIFDLLSKAIRQMSTVDLGEPAVVEVARLSVASVT